MRAENWQANVVSFMNNPLCTNFVQYFEIPEKTSPFYKMNALKFANVLKQDYASKLSQGYGIKDTEFGDLIKIGETLLGITLIIARQSKCKYLKKELLQDAINFKSFAPSKILVYFLSNLLLVCDDKECVAIITKMEKKILDSRMYACALSTCAFEAVGNDTWPVTKIILEYKRERNISATELTDILKCFDNMGIRKYNKNVFFSRFDKTRITKTTHSFLSFVPFASSLYGFDVMTQNEYIAEKLVLDYEIDNFSLMPIAILSDAFLKKPILADIMWSRISLFKITEYGIYVQNYFDSDRFLSLIIEMFAKMWKILCLKCNNDILLVQYCRSTIKELPFIFLNTDTMESVFSTALRIIRPSVIENNFFTLDALQTQEFSHNVTRNELNDQKFNNAIDSNIFL